MVVGGFVASNWTLVVTLSLFGSPCCVLGRCWRSHVPVWVEWCGAVHEERDDVMKWC